MRVFLDANVILDRYDLSRPFSQYSIKAYEYLLLNAQIFTSCDLITTIYYINSREDKYQALKNIQNISKTLKIIEFSNKEVEESCSLMLSDSDYSDLEDTLQSVLAKKSKCGLIISNDERFVSKEIRLLTSKAFCEEYIK
jgi:predicted nucleic acid-binding protein